MRCWWVPKPIKSRRCWWKLHINCADMREYQPSKKAGIEFLLHVVFSFLTWRIHFQKIKYKLRNAMHLIAQQGQVFPRRTASVMLARAIIFFPVFLVIIIKCLKGYEMFVTCYIVLSKAAFRPQTTSCTRTLRTWHFELNKREQITQTRHISILSFLPGHVLTMQLLIYDFFRGSTNHDETLNPLFSGPFPFSLGEGEKKTHIKCPSAHEHRNN